MTLSNRVYYLWMDEAFWWKTSKAFLPIILPNLVWHQTVPFKDLADVKGQNFYLGVCSLFFFQLFLIFILMSNENKICSLHFLHAFFEMSFSKHNTCTSCLRHSSSTHTFHQSQQQMVRSWLPYSESNHAVSPA